MTVETYDLAVIGSGPGGSAAALTAARRGLRVCLIEREQLGGVCLNVGCIPTKALIAVSHFLRRLRRAAQWGIRLQGYDLDYSAVRARNERIVTTLRRGLTDLVRHEQVSLVTGEAAFESPHRVRVTHDNQTTILEASHVILATGAHPLAGPWAFDERRVLSYRGLLALSELPASLLIIGGGVIGCEFASCFAALGSRVTVIEQQPTLLPLDEPEAVRPVTRALQADGVTVLTNTTVTRVDSRADGVDVTLADGTMHHASHVLIAIGQRPNIESLALSAAGVASGRGVTVDAHLRASQPHIAAIGDCVEGHGLAHWASAEGAVAARNLLGDLAESVDPLWVPRCIFTAPEIAHVGPLESTLAGAVRVSRFAFGALGRSHCDDDTEGFVKMLIDPSTDQVRGATVVGAHASSLIHVAVVAMRHGVTAKQLARTITAHPTMPEAITEAAAHAYGESLCVSARCASRRPTSTSAGAPPR